MNQSILIENNELISIKGATRVASSTQSQAVVETQSNSIIITGSEIEVKKLNLESSEVSFSGKFTNIRFSSLSGNKVPLIKRIFK